MGIIAMKPLGGGLLENAGLCFKFLQQYPDVVPIPGIASSEELEEIIALYDSPSLLGKEDREEIDRIRADLGKDFCHRCRYCLPCEQEVQIADIMTFRSMAKRLTPPIALAIVKGPMESVDNCTDCEECLAKCPYNLAIPDMIREQRKLYDEMAVQYAWFQFLRCPGFSDLHDPSAVIGNTVFQSEFPVSLRRLPVGFIGKFDGAPV